MRERTLALSEDLHRSIWSHLTGPSLVEEAGFVFANEPNGDPGYAGFRGTAWLPVPPEGFAVQSSLYFELTDEFRARVIRESHRRGQCIVEFHSHTGMWPAAFSVSDMHGLSEFVPHVMWRLKRPYAAVVVAGDTFDGLLWWPPGSRGPSRLEGISVGGEFMRSTRLTRIEAFGGRSHEQQV